MREARKRSLSKSSWTTPRLPCSKFSEKNTDLALAMVAASMRNSEKVKPKWSLTLLLYRDLKDGFFFRKKGKKRK